MICPVDQAELLMTERQGIEIDYCPKCRGVWLDRGELDKLIERISAPARDDDRYDRRPSRDDDRYDPRSSRDDDRYDDDDRSSSRPPYKSRRKSLLGELFDIG